MIKVSRSIYGAQLQSNLLFGLPHNPPANSTLNETYDIYDQLDLLDAEVPSLNYYAIGNKGHRLVNAAWGGKTSTIGHGAGDAGVYQALPFVIRPAASDLDATTRAKYGMRVPIDIGGTMYWAYYLKRIDKSNLSSELKLTTVNEGIKTTTTFSPDNSNLTPTPPELPNSGVITSNGSMLSVVTVLDISLDANDVAEIVNAADILFGDPEAAIISEIAMVTAYPKVVNLLTVNRTSTSGTYVEAIKAQTAAFAGSSHQLTSANNGIKMTLNMGASEPLFGPTFTTVTVGP